MDNKIFIDIETIPSDTMPSLDDMSAPANYKDEAKIKAYKEANQLEAWKKQALNSMQGRIICIGYSWNGQIKSRESTFDEQSVLFEFNMDITEIIDLIRSPLVFIGWNISTFDLPWIWRKSIQYSLPELRKAIPKDNRTQYIDLMKVWASDYKDYVSLDNCAKFLGIEHYTESGSSVFDWWQAGQIDKIEEHCKKDIKTTVEIYNRIYGG
jgi:3'-5' exonuclease